MISILNFEIEFLNFSLSFKSGATGTFNSVLETPLYIRYAVFGSEAWVEARDYCHPSEEGTTDFFICRNQGKIEKTSYSAVDTSRKLHEFMHITLRKEFHR